MKSLNEYYKFEVVPIVVDATSIVINSLAKLLEKPGFYDIKGTTRSCQKNALSGTLKTVTNFMKM